MVAAGVARTFQNTQLFEEMTALENVMVGAQAHQRRGFAAAALRLPSARRRGPRRRRGGRAPAAPHRHRRVGRRRPPPTCPPASGACSRSPARSRRSPRLLLLDEPAAGLNATETGELVQTLYRVRDGGITVLVVEHDMGLVMEVSDEIVVLDRGRKIAEGPPRMIQKDPAVIAAYLGEEVDDV